MQYKSPVFKTRRGQAKYLAAYESMLELWPVPYASFYIPTRFGNTHVIASGPQDGPVNLLLHGFGISSTMWFPNIGPLSAKYRTYALDFVGDANRSIVTCPPKNRSQCSDWLEDVFEQLQIAKANIIGLSYGGWLALNFALTNPVKVICLVLLAPAASFVPLRKQFWVRGAGLVAMPIRPVIKRTLHWFAAKGYLAHDKMLDQFAASARHCLPRVRTIPNVFKDDELQQLSIPTLLMVGDEEAIYNPVKVIKRAKSLIPGIEAELITGAGHLLNIEKSREVNNHILNFLAQNNS